MACGAWLDLFTFLVVAGFTFINADVIVDTNNGKVKGKEVSSIIEGLKYYSFMGIPYGLPPLGELRFKAPKPYPKWEKVVDARYEKLHCPQFNFPVRPKADIGFCGNEDCLHLGIHTPKLPTNGELDLPVIVFIQNENFRLTNNATKDYGPDFFMSEEVIVVMVSYRVASLGFLSYEDDVLPGNNGIRDVILALKWLQDNIDRFGGDKSRVTLMGQKGGATLVEILIHSAKAKGLFTGAILQSGTIWSSSYFNEQGKGRLRAKALAEALDILCGSSSLLLKELKRLSAEKIVTEELNSIHADETRESQMDIVAFGPAIEHDHPDAVITKLPEPKDVNIPIMVGYNTREGMEISERLLRKPQYLTVADKDFLFLFPTRVNYKFKLNTKSYNDAVQRIKNFYFEEGYIKISRLGEYLTYIGDIMSFYPIDYMVRKYVNESTYPVYYYTFDYSGDLNWRKKNLLKAASTMDGTWGAATGDELCYLFVCKPIQKEYEKALADPDSDDVKVVRNMIRLWTNFAKSGNPTPPGEEFTWTPATKENKECLVISDELELKNNLNQERVKFWDDFIAKYATLAVKGVITDEKDEL